MVFAGRNFAYFGELAETDNALLLPNRFHWCLPQRVRSRAGPREGDVPLLCARAKWMQPVATMTAEHHKLAIADAQEAKPFGVLTGNRTTDADLFHLAPLVALKFRGRKVQGPEAERVTKTALANCRKL